MDDPHKWDRWDSTAVRPLTKRRFAMHIGFRVFAFASVTVLASVVLVMALHEQSRSLWTLFGLLAFLWVMATATYTFVVVLLIRARRRQKATTHE